jgi:hypothetical protein
MKTPLLFIVLLQAATMFSQEPTHATIADRALSAKAVVTEQQYCLNYSHEFTVYFKLNLTFVNQSKTDVVLARRVKTPVIRISATLADAQSKRFLYNPDPYYVSVAPPENPAFGAAPDPQLFIILKSGEEYHTTQWTGIYANLTTKKRETRSGVVAGDYIAQAIVNTWPFGTLPDSNIVESWRMIGLLSNETVESAFFQVSFPIVKKAKSCRTFNAPK